jgi:hypothetical protein
MRPPNQRQSKAGTPRAAGDDRSQGLYGSLKSMLDWQALLKKIGVINFRVGSARRAEKIAIISCGFKNRAMMAGSAENAGHKCRKAVVFWWQKKSKNCLTRTKNPVYNLRLS